MKIVTTQQMKAMEAASLEHGMTYLQLMDNAGKAAAEFIRNLIREPETTRWCGRMSLRLLLAATVLWLPESCSKAVSRSLPY